MRHAALFPILVITLEGSVGMSLADIIVLQALFGVAVVVLEFPSGLGFAALGPFPAGAPARA
jgi:hypothetical protein